MNMFRIEFEFRSTLEIAIQIMHDSNTNPAGLDRPLMTHVCGLRWWNNMALSTGSTARSGGAVKGEKHT